MILYLEHPLFRISLYYLLDLLDVIVEYRSLDHGGCHPLVLLLLLCPISIFELLLPPLLPREDAMRPIHHDHLALLFARGILIDSLTEWRELNLRWPVSLPLRPNGHLRQGNIGRLRKPVALDVNADFIGHEGDGGPGLQENVVLPGLSDKVRGHRFLGMVVWGP